MPGETQERSHHHRKQSMTCVAPAPCFAVASKHFHSGKNQYEEIQLPAEQHCGSVLGSCRGVGCGAGLRRRGGSRHRLAAGSAQAHWRPQRTEPRRRAPGVRTAGPAERVRKGGF